MVAVPGGEHLHSVSGSADAKGTMAVALPYISLRSATSLEFAKWTMALENALIVHNLVGVREDGEIERSRVNFNCWRRLDYEKIIPSPS